MTTEVQVGFTPTSAREYIKQFAEHTFKGTTHVDFKDGSRVYLDNMSDEDAVRVAYGFYNIEAEAAQKAIKQ